MTTLEPKDSRLTLVDEVERAQGNAPSPQEQTPLASPTSPFSASFDPNAPTPATPPDSLVSPMTTYLRNPPSRASQEVWTNSLSSSLSTLAAQFTAASQALCAIPAAIPSEGGLSSDGILIIQQAQAKLEEELDSLKEQVTRLQGHGRRSEKEKERAVEIDGSEDFEGRLQRIERRLDELGETIRLDQSRLYARLQNCIITSNKMQLTPLAMSNGKTPQNFPNTKGEFEHLTKERYEHLMKSYGLPIRGDTAAKRQAVREFIGLTPAKP